jgi:hypothetical protein
VGNLADITLATDNVFSDGSDTQLAAVTGTRARRHADGAGRGLIPLPYR